MRRVWVIIPLVLVVSMIGIVGIDESFAEDSLSMECPLFRFGGSTIDFIEISLQYDILEGTVSNICFYEQSLSILIKIDAHDDGMLTIDVPRQLLDPLRFDCTNGEFIVLVEGVESDYGDIESTIYSRNIGIAFTNETTTIEIIFPGYIEAYNNLVNCTKQPDYNSKYLPPAKQIALGIHSIKCNEGLMLIYSFEYSFDHEWEKSNPYCVKPETAKKLDERGWIKNHPGYSLPGRYHVNVDSIRITDISGNSIPHANLNQETLIISDLTYSKYKDQPLVYAVVINNPDGTIDIHQIEDTLKMGQLLSPSISWIPTQIGTHQVELFFWESIDSLRTIAPPSFHTIEVKGE